MSNEKEPVESRTAQFYQAGSDAGHPELVRIGARNDKYEMARHRLMAEHPHSDQPRIKVRLGGPTHTITRPTTLAEKQEK